MVKVGIEGEKEKSKRFAEIETNSEKRNKGPYPRFPNIFILVAYSLLVFIFLPKKNHWKLRKLLVQKRWKGPPLPSPRLKLSLKPSKDKPRKENCRPPRYPVAPVQEQPIPEPSIQEDYVPDDIDLVDELPDEETHTIKNRPQQEAEAALSHLWMKTWTSQLRMFWINNSWRKSIHPKKVMLFFLNG